MASEFLRLRGLILYEDGTFRYRLWEERETLSHWKYEDGRFYFKHGWMGEWYRWPSTPADDEEPIEQEIITALTDNAVQDMLAGD